MAVERWRPLVSIARWDPFHGTADIQSELNRLFEFKATYRDGVLAVKLPKAEEVKPRSIKIDIL